MYSKTNKVLFHIVFFVLITHFCWSQNIAPTLTAEGNQPYCPQSQINIVTNFNIVDPDDTEIEALYVQISTGYVQGEDSLTLLGVHPNITTSWNAIEGKLALKGIASALVSYIDLIAATKEIVFNSTSINPTDKTFSITIGDANYLPKTDHYYEYVADYGITWKEAKIAAENKTYFGLKGYLVTITSAEEAQFSGEQATGTGWIGGTDEETEGVWKWVTGPESGTVFWNGNVNGSSPNYANWNYNEPNNVNGGEDYAHITDPSIGIKGAWNDLRVGGDPPGLYHPKGYVVEYGSPSESSLDISASSSIYVLSTVEPNSADLTLSKCDDLSDGDDTNGIQTFDLTANEVKLLNGSNAADFTLDYYKDSSHSLPIITPNAFENIIPGGQTVYVRISSTVHAFCYVDTSFYIRVDELPDIESSIVFKNCDVDGISDGFTDFNLEEANDIITNNSSTGLDITYYTDLVDAQNGTINAISNPESFNNSNSNTVYARVENSDDCFAISEVTLEVSTTSFPLDFFEELTSCDDDNDIDGFYEFDLTMASQSFLDKLPLGQNLSVHYFESLNDAQLEQNEILSIYENKDAFSQRIYVRVENDDNGDCFGIGSHLQLTVHPRPEFEVRQSKTLCSNEEAVTLFILNPKGNYTYEWKNSTGEVISNLHEAEVSLGGVYTVIATSEFQCESFIEYNVEESSSATIDSNDIEIVELTDNNSITINNKNNNLGIGDYEFSLDDIDGPYQDESYFDSVTAGSHIVYVKDKNGCGITPIEVFILGFPKFFTPNNDGVNDTWQIKGLGTDYTNASKVSVYNRYGKLIKQLTSKSGAWDGTFNGEFLPDSDYWFLAELVETTGEVRVYRGHFSLIR